VKRAHKDAEPASLLAFRLAQPRATWDELRNGALNDGQLAYQDIRACTHANQGGLCAYCEIDIRDNDSLKSRIEHFHPKSDTTTPTNWALDWPNLLAVCAGGSYRHGAVPHTLEPLAENLSCDAHKDRLIQQGQLPEACEGLLLNPLLLPDTPSLFDVDKFSGRLRPHATNCEARAPWPGNRHANLEALVAHTILVLNLNCQRLCDARRTVIHDIERNKKRQRLAGAPPQQGLQRLAERYLQQAWPGFVTTIRICLGDAAERRLQALLGP
jgi:uncharacterized protein (TIGR02646 family)